METGTRRAVVAVGAAVFAALAWWLGREPDSGAPAVERAPQAPGDAHGIRGRTAVAGAEPPSLLVSKAAVSGIVRTRGGGPVHGAQVCAFRLLPGVDPPLGVPCARSERNGHYRIDGLRSGRFELTASAPQHAPGRYVPEEPQERGVRLRVGSERVGTDIELPAGGVQVRGTVRDLSGGVVPGAEVRRAQGWWVGSGLRTAAIADDEGAFSMWVEPGAVLLAASAEGYVALARVGRAPAKQFDLYMTPAATLVGRVTDASTGAPVPDATVVVWDRSTSTDPSGKFRIEGLWPGSQRPVVTAESGYGEAEHAVHLGVGETSEPVEITLHSAVTVSGSVLVQTERGVSPCESGEVRLAPKKGTGGVLRSADVEEQGAVRITGVLPGGYEVMVRCEGYLHAPAYEALEVTNVAIEGQRWTVTEGATIRGRVIVDDAADLELLTVQAESFGDQTRGRFGRASTRRIAADGSFVLTGLPANDYRLSAMGPGVAVLETPVEVTLVEDESVEGVLLELDSAATLRGRVQDPEGNPIAPAGVMASGAGGVQSSQVSEDGRFEIRGLAGGEYRVWAALEWGLPLRGPGTTDDDEQGSKVTVDAGGAAEVIVVVEPRDMEISGVVRDTSGAPLSDAIIVAKRVPDSEKKQAAGQAHYGGWNRLPIMTDIDGHFTVPSLSRGSYTVWAMRGAGGDGHVQDVLAGSEGVLIEVAEPGQLSGRVVLPSGEVPSRFEVFVRDESTGFAARESFFRTQGRFHFERVPPGALELAATAAGSKGRLEVSLSEGQSVDDLELLVEP